MSKPPDVPGVYRVPSTPGVSDLLPYADRVCDSVNGLNMVDALSVMIGTIISTVLSCKSRLPLGDDHQVIDVIVHNLPAQYRDCAKRFAYLNEAQLQAVAAKPGGRHDH
jgi:hypothetical protein